MRATAAPRGPERAPTVLNPARPHLAGPVTVAGAGAIGLTVALRLQDAGAWVTLFDPDPPGRNASAVAAGMLAPAFEAALDGAPNSEASGHLPLFRAARDLWPALAERLNAPGLLDRSGALWAALPGDAAGLERVAAALGASGARFEALEGGQPRRLLPTLSKAVNAALFTPEDWRLDAGDALARLARAFDEAGGTRVTATLPLDAPTPLVIATGAGGRALAVLAPELAHLTPIKGQLLRIGGGPTGGPVVRGAGGYIAPSAGGALVGATMEVGRDDLAVDPQASARLAAFAGALMPGLAGAALTAGVGVRAATPDGLPLVGWSRAPGVLLATGMRRNGWLLAPLVAELALAYLARTDPGRLPLNPWAVALDPRRFDLR